MIPFENYKLFKYSKVNINFSFIDLQKLENKTNHNYFTKIISRIILNDVYIDLYLYKGSFRLFMYDEYEYYFMELRQNSYNDFIRLCDIFGFDRNLVLEALLSSVRNEWNIDYYCMDMDKYRNLVTILETTPHIGKSINIDVNKLQKYIKAAV